MSGSDEEDDYLLSSLLKTVSSATKKRPEKCTQLLYSEVGLEPESFGRASGRYRLKAHAKESAAFKVECNASALETVVAVLYNQPYKYNYDEQLLHQILHAAHQLHLSRAHINKLIALMHDSIDDHMEGHTADFKTMVEWFKVLTSVSKACDHSLLMKVHKRLNTLAKRSETSKAIVQAEMLKYEQKMAAK